ncbi:hypothetical protein ES711_08095 [Gelidibacter salicanalis]|uniref:O-antigen ligase family protein n=1 Tax=Gelidibacter salicanalis TaxID=291193 RepID=A0A5C7AIP6_9FLAO|nr:hypothetical protein [Gelidibacter salicanalis]TXE08458.1 hypothetical protein ES711_08095 [Gelidibacter salicanalis]
MDINWYGFSLVICSLIWVGLYKKVRFVELFVFFIPFNSTAVLYIKGTPVSLPLVLFCFAFSSFLLKSILNSRISYPKASRISIRWLLVIGLVVVLSEIMPFIINGSYKVLDRYNSLVFYAKEIPLVPNIQWITQMLYFIIGLLVVFLITVSYKTMLEIKTFLKFFISGIIFMICWGWFEIFCFFIDVDYPYYIFDHIGMSKQGSLIGDYGFPRMISVTFEASYLAQLLIPAIPFFYWSAQEHQKIVFSTLFNKIFYIISTLTLIVAQTSTGILGFLITTGLLLKNRMQRFSKRIRILLVLLFIILCVIALFFAIIIVLEKSNEYSGIERLKTVTLGFKYFLDYPLLGLGWGVFPTYDLLINLLANFGLLGTIPFLILLRNIYYRFLKLIKLNDKNKHIYKAGLESFILILVVSQLSGFIYHSQYFWMYLGLAISISSISSDKLAVK